MFIAIIGNIADHQRSIDRSFSHSHVIPIKSDAIFDVQAEAFPQMCCLIGWTAAKQLCDRTAPSVSSIRPFPSDGTGRSERSLRVCAGCVPGMSWHVGKLGKCDRAVLKRVVREKISFVRMVCWLFGTIETVSKLIIPSSGMLLRKQGKA